MRIAIVAIPEEYDLDAGFAPAEPGGMPGALRLAEPPHYRAGWGLRGGCRGRSRAGRRPAARDDRQAARAICPVDAGSGAPDPERRVRIYCGKTAARGSFP